MLLRHTNESLAALDEAIGTGCIGLAPAADDGDLAADPAGVFRDRACRLLNAWTTVGHPHWAIAIADRSIMLNTLASAGPLEIAVHGWDISRACGHRQPIPDTLAIDLLAITPLLVPGTARHPLFAAPVTLALAAGPRDRLAAFLGRTPQA